MGWNRNVFWRIAEQGWMASNKLHVQARRDMLTCLRCVEIDDGEIWTTPG